jgi:hypothetical protein
MLKAVCWRCRLIPALRTCKKRWCTPTSTVRPSLGGGRATRSVNQRIFSSVLIIIRSVADLRYFFRSRIRLFSILDPGSEFFPYRFCIKEFQYFNPQKFFLSSRKYDPGCSFQIPDPDRDFLSIPNPGFRIQGSKRHRIPDFGSWIRTRNTDYL